MAKLQRITNKIFGENATAVGNDPQIGQFGSASAGTYVGTTDVATIQNLPAWGQGWIGAVTPTQQFPALPEMTGAMKVLSYQTAYNQQMGIPEYDNATTYYTNSFCQVDGVIYKSKADDNQGNDPTEESSDYWEVLNLGGGYHPPILSCMWSDHLINDIQWLRADTFSWQDGDVYTTAYNKLVEEYSTGTEETEGSITFKRTSNGFKIATANQETVILNKYNTDGIAWYYILDTTNKRFKLPRCKYKYWKNFSNNTLPVKGNGMTLGLEASNGNFGATIHTSSTPFVYGASDTYGKSIGTSYGGSSPTILKSIGITTDSSNSGIVADSTSIKNNTEETGFYLYFYVGEYTQTAIEQTAGLNAELFNGKLDVATYNNNPRTNAVYLKTTYVNGTSGYNIWSNGYCEQWGVTTGNTTTTLVKKMKDTNYNIVGNMRYGYWCKISFFNLTETSFYNSSVIYDTSTGGNLPVGWKVSGYLAEGEY